jgi:intron-binding protein aquarius
VVKNAAFEKYSNLDQSLFARFIQLGVPHMLLDQQGRTRPGMAELFNWKYAALGNLPRTLQPEYKQANAGFRFDYQLVDVPDYQGVGEFCPKPHFFQNMGEAEYIVATFMYMRTLGYPAEKITILTTYKGQKHLIRDILQRRCGPTSPYGMPQKVLTVDKFQGQQNDYILLSLVRTAHVGHIRDVRRLVVAMSRARLGLYVFCRQTLFQNCYELTPVFQHLLARPTALTLMMEEKYGETERQVDSDQIDVGKLKTVEGLAEMGQLAAVGFNFAFGAGKKK